MSRNERFNMTNATDKQMELGFNGATIRMAAPRRAGRMARAGWWFAQMRTVVQQAMDWNAVEAPRPEQIWIPGATREVKV